MPSRVARVQVERRAGSDRPVSDVARGAKHLALRVSKVRRDRTTRTPLDRRALPPTLTHGRSIQRAPAGRCARESDAPHG